MPKSAQFIEESKSLRPESASTKPKRTVHPNSLANLRPFEPGVSGNPGGKPKYDVAAQLARAVIEGNMEAAYEGLARQLSKGNAYAFKELADRGYGKLKETKEVTHIHGDVPEAELNDRIAALERDLGLARAIDEAGRAGIAAAGASEASGQPETANVLP